MATKNKNFQINFKAFNTSTNSNESGDSANISMFVSKDGGAGVGVTNAITELTNLDGIYTFLATAAEMNGKSLIFGGVSTTADVEIVEVYIETEDLSNTAEARISIADVVSIPTGSTSMAFPIDFLYYSLIDNGFQIDPTANEVKVSIRAINGAVDKLILFDDEALSTGATSAGGSFFLMDQVTAGKYRLYYKLTDAADAPDTWLFTFQVTHNGIEIQYTYNISIIDTPMTAVGGVDINDNNANKTVIAKALKDQDVSSTVAIAGSIYLDLITQINLIVAKLPSGLISDLGLTTQITPGNDLGKVLRLIKALINGRYKKDDPNPGEITFYEDDNSTVITTSSVTNVERLRIL